MGLFDFFRKKPSFIDNVYRTAQSKHDSIVARLKDSFSNGNIPIVVYHFSNNRKLIVDLLNRSSIAFRDRLDLSCHGFQNQSSGPRNGLKNPLSTTLSARVPKPGSVNITRRMPETFHKNTALLAMTPLLSR